MLQTRERYEVKTFAYNEDVGPGLYRIMVVRFNGNGNEVLEQAGWRGNYCMFMEVSGGARYATNDEYEFSNELTAYDDDSLLNFLRKLKSSDSVWNRVEDGREYTPSDIKKIV